MMNEICSAPNSASSPVILATKEITLAIERNEVNGACGIGWTGLPTVRPDWFQKQ